MERVAMLEGWREALVAGKRRYCDGHHCLDATATKALPLSGGLLMIRSAKTMKENAVSPPQPDPARRSTTPRGSQSAAKLNGIDPRAWFSDHPASHVHDATALNRQQTSCGKPVKAQTTFADGRRKLQPGFTASVEPAASYQTADFSGPSAVVLAAERAAKISAVDQPSINEPQAAPNAPKMRWLGASKISP